MPQDVQQVKIVRQIHLKCLSNLNSGIHPQSGDRKGKMARERGELAHWPWQLCSSAELVGKAPGESAV